MKHYRIKSRRIHNLTHMIFPWIICGLGGLFYCYEYLLRVTPSVMSNQVISYFHTDAAGFGFLASSYYYIYAAMQLFVGILIDSYGPRRLMSLACLSCAVGIALFAAVPNYYIALLGRLFIGFGSAFAFVGVLKLASIWLPQRFFALISGITTALGMLGGILGDLLLTHLVHTIGWRHSCFYASLFGVALAVAILILIKRARAYYLKRKIPKQRPNLKHSMQQLVSLLRNRNIWLNGIIAGCLYMSVPVFADSWGISYLTQSLHFSPASAALMCSTIYLGWVIGAPFAGWLTEYIQSRRVPLITGAILSLIVAVILLYSPHPSRHLVYTLCFLMGFFSSVEIISFAVARDMTSTQNTATAVAVTNMLLMISGWFVGLSGLVLKLISPPAIKGAIIKYSHFDYEVALSIIPIFLILAIILLFFLPETHGSPSD